MGPSTRWRFPPTGPIFSRDCTTRDDITIKVWDTDSFNLLKTRPGEAMAFSEEAEGVVRNGATIRVKDGVVHSMRRARSCVWL